MDKQSADRIIVKSNARMEIVLDWFSKNREQMKELALYPGEPEAYLYADTEGERLPLAGGGWRNGASAGVFNLNLGTARSNSYGSLGFRSAFYGKLDSEV